MTQEEKFEKMTTQPIPSLVSRLAVPTILSMLVTSFYNMVDTYFVGKINTSASGAVGVVFSLMAIIQAFGFMFGQGAGSILSRALGGQDRERASVHASVGFFGAMFFGLVITVFGLSSCSRRTKCLCSIERVYGTSSDV